jgi:hypothetical protein
MASDSVIVEEVRREERITADHYTLFILMRAMTRALITPFNGHDWHAWSGAVGFPDGEQPHIVEFHYSDLRLIQERLGISHWGRNCFVVLDYDVGLTFNGWENGSAYAYQVNLSLTCDNWDGKFVEQEER